MRSETSSTGSPASASTLRVPPVETSSMPWPAGNGQMKPEQLEIAQLKREVAKLKAERDMLKKAAAYFAKEST